MNTQSKGSQRIYDRFRSSDDQINFLMSEKGEISLDRQIVKMMKDMSADEIAEFANQFFKFKQNQCSSLQMLVNNELSMRERQSEVEKCNENDVSLSNVGFEVVDNNDIVKQRMVSNLDSLPNIIREMNKIKQTLQENCIQTTNSKTQQNQEQNQDKIHFTQYKYDDYVPKLSPDQDYLTMAENDGQYIQFDRLPSYLLFQSVQNNQNQKLKQKNNQSTNLMNLQIQKKLIIAENIKTQDKSVKINVQSTKKQQKTQSNLHLSLQKHNDPEEIYQNQQQVQSSMPTTVEQNQELDFEELSRIILPGNKFKITYNNGDQYQGELQNQMKNGWGDYHYNTGERYQGFFVDDEIHGYGEYFFLSGASYEGDWSSGMKHGIGILKFGNGDIYQGQFVRDHFHGKGTYNYANGDVFTGIWKNGQKHGKGKLQTFDGSLQIGTWVCDKFQI